jgi:hypothetical protein
LNCKPSSRIADVRYGKGAFWPMVNLTQFTFVPSDLLMCPDAPYAFRHLSDPDNDFDVVVLDPPYMHNPGRPLVNNI